MRTLKQISAGAGLAAIVTLKEKEKDPRLSPG